jgi:hypothetical protein
VRLLAKSTKALTRRSADHHVRFRKLLDQTNIATDYVIAEISGVGACRVRIVIDREHAFEASLPEAQREAASTGEKIYDSRSNVHPAFSYPKRRETGTEDNSSAKYIGAR